MDALGSVLSAMKLTGSVFLRADFSAPWCVTSQIMPQDCAAYFSAAAHVIAYHYAVEGDFLCAVEGGEPMVVHAGQIMLAPRNEKHFLGSSLTAAPVNARQLIQPPGDEPIARIIWGGGGAPTTVYCGFMGTLTPINAFLLSLPSIMVVDASGSDSGEWLASSIRYAATAAIAGSPEVASKLSELLLLEAVRQYVETLPSDGTGWLAGLRDRHLSRALMLLHERHAEDWTTDALAREVGLSRSALAERFSCYLGEPPMRYLSRHRMNVAANLLRDSAENSANIAYAVGFNSEAAFSRAFRKEFGMPPGSWRRPAA